MDLNPAYNALPAYPFPRLRTLLSAVRPGHNDPIDLTLGAPRQAPPAFVKNILADGFSDFGHYPPIAGTPALKDAIAGWLARRYRAALEPTAILPLVGTREGLYMLAQLAVRPGRDQVLLPNPFYPAYNAAALTMKAKPVYMTCDLSSGFLPNLAALDPALLDKTALMFLCSPSNPQGAAATRGYLTQALALARQHDFLLAVDECYAEIWTHEPPCGALEAAGDDHSHLVVFHSLSKRSNLPGLRSGFIAGDRTVINAFEKLRSYGGPTMPLPLQAASAACWADQGHVEEARALYDAKFTLAERILGITRPQGGFFLWLPVEDDEKTAHMLWKDHAIKVLPGQYLASESENGQNPGRGYIRIALVESVARTRAALERIAAAL